MKQTKENSTQKKSWFRRHYILTVIGVLIVIGIINAGSHGKKTDTTNVPAEKTPMVTTEQANAILPKVAKENVSKNPVQPVKTPTETATAPTTAKSYQQVFTFSGSGVKKSEPFTITGSRFKIQYNCTGDMCQAFLYKTDKNTMTGLVMNTTGSTKDETIFYGAGDYYIDANTLGSFTMIVEDYK